MFLHDLANNLILDDNLDCKGFIEWHSTSAIDKFSERSNVSNSPIFSWSTIFSIITWLAIIPGDILPASTSSGHLGQRNVRQKLYSVSGLLGFSLTDMQMELQTAGQSKVLEQLGHDKINGSQPRYLHFNL